MAWQGDPVSWVVGDVVYFSVAFTYNLRKVLSAGLIYLRCGKRVVVGGAATKLVPGFFDGTGIDQQDEYVADPNVVLQIVNKDAIRTSIGCPNSCSGCGVKTIEPESSELESWPDGFEVMDNNFLANTDRHIEKVVRSLVDRCPENPKAVFHGIDPRFITADKADQLSMIKDLTLRAGFDSWQAKDTVEKSVDILRAAGIAKKKIRLYALIGHDTGPEEAWKRCLYIAKEMKLTVSPMWFHPLDAMHRNIVTPEQEKLGWDDFERRKIMQWFYFRKDLKRKATQLNLFGKGE